MKSKQLVKWLKKRVQQAGAKGVILGLSGGVDSAVVGALCKAAFPNTTLGLFMPCYSNPQDLKDARLAADKFKIKTKLIDLSETFRVLYQQLTGQSYDGKTMSLAVANLKPRLRMLTLYYHANLGNYLVVGTGNRSEAVMGYCTKYGDGGVDLLPLAGLLKTEVRKLAVELGVPSQIIEKAPSAGLWAGQTDEGEMGITYAELDKIIVALDKKKTKGLDPEKVKLVKTRLQAHAHKFNPPPAF